MKYLVLDDTHKTDSLIALLTKKKVDASVCVSSNDFLAAVNTPSKFDALLINADSWGKGRAMYEYFDIGPKLARKPVIFYNVEEEGTGGIKDREPFDADMVLHKPADIEEAVAAICQA